MKTGVKFRHCLVEDTRRMIPTTQGLNRAEEWTAAALWVHEQYLVKCDYIFQQIYPESQATVDGIQNWTWYSNIQRRMEETDQNYI